MFPNSGQVTGIISEVAFSFIVQEPSGIMQCVSERSLAASRLMYRSICDSEWCVLKMGWVKKADWRARAPYAGAAAAASAMSASAEKLTAAPPLKAAHAASTSARDVVSSHASVSVCSSSWRKLSPFEAPAARTASALVPAGTMTRTVSKKGVSGEVQPSLSKPARSKLADVCACEAISLNPSGPWYIPYSAAMFARRACAVQMFEVALSRRMCCSRVCMAIR